MELSGRILDFDTHQPVPFASITITRPDGTYTGIGAQTNINGQFFLSNPVADYPNYFTVSSVGYYTQKAQLYEDFFIDYGGDFLLKKNTKDLDPVVVTANRNSQLAWLLLPALILLAKKDDNKKSVGKIRFDNKTILTIALAGGVLLSWKLIRQLLCKVGILDCTPSESTTDSPWSLTYYTNHATTADIFSLEAASASFKSKAQTIYNAFGIFQDNYSAIMGVFQTMQNKISVSFLSEIFYDLYNVNLLSFLKDGGGILPWDGLSAAHLQNIDNYINTLPIK
jgi:hypothetical protein